jgi:predicted outer membrane repeat protein
MLHFHSLSSLTEGVVETCDHAGLEAALAGGGQVTFDCSGVILLTNTINITSDTILDGTGRSVTISGNDLVRIFNVRTNVNFTLIKLTLAHGKDARPPGSDSRSPRRGGAILIDGGTLAAMDCEFSSNQALGDNGLTIELGGSAFGGAIYNHAGTLNLTNCGFFSNRAQGGQTINSPISPLSGGSAFGAAIHNDRGTVVLVGSRLVGNTARGGFGSFPYGSVGSGLGGALYSTNGSFQCSNCTFSTNDATVGGAAYANGGSATLVSSVLSGNTALSGGAIYATGGSVSLVASVLSGNTSENFGSESSGGAIFNQAHLAITDCTFSNNATRAGTGRRSSYAGAGGALYNLWDSTIIGTTFSGNMAVGGRGGYADPLIGAFPGANGMGGGIFSTGVVSLVNCTFYRNIALGGDGYYYSPDSSDGGPGQGGAVHARSGTVAVTNVSFEQNSAKGGRRGHLSRSDGASLGGAIYVWSNAAANVLSSILANSLSGSNCFGALTDAGHNLSSDPSCNFSAAGSLNSTDPRLGPFGDYGGLTPTVPLLAGSPAIDAGDPAACPGIDQRGFSRLFGNGCDIGAFESAPPYTVNGLIRGYLSPSGVTVNIDSNAVPVDPSGFYSFTGLSAGNYLVSAAAAQTRFVPASRILQVARDSVDIDLQAYQLYALTAEVVANSSNLAYQNVFVGDLETTYRTEVSVDLLSWSTYSTNTTDTNGFIILTNLMYGGDNSRFFRVAKP